MKNKNLRYSVLLALFSLSCSLSAQFVHSFSGTSFPKEIEHFTYTGTRQYDDIGKDISAGYRTLSSIELTQYIYPPTGEDLQTHFLNYKKMLLDQKKRSKVISSEDIKTRGIDGKFLKLELYDNFNGTDRKLYSYLFIYQYKGWFIMLRITCITDYNEMIEKEIYAYIPEMPFPTIDYK
jgi:hypothetical protein